MPNKRSISNSYLHKDWLKLIYIRVLDNRELTMSGIAAAVGVALVAGVAEGSSVLQHCYKKNTTSTINEEEEDGGAPKTELQEVAQDQVNANIQAQNIGEDQQQQQQTAPKLFWPSVVYGSLALPLTAVGSSPSVASIVRLTNLPEPPQSLSPSQDQISVESPRKMQMNVEHGLDSSVVQERSPEAEFESAGREELSVVQQVTDEEKDAGSAHSNSGGNDRRSRLGIGNRMGMMGDAGNVETSTSTTTNHKRRTMKLGFPANPGAGTGNTTGGGRDNNTTRIESVPSPALRNPAGGLDVQRFREDNRRALAAMRERNMLKAQEQGQSQGQYEADEIETISTNTTTVTDTTAMEVASNAQATTVGKNTKQAAQVQTLRGMIQPSASSSSTHLPPPTRTTGVVSTNHVNSLDGRVLPTKMAQNMRNLRIAALGYGVIHATIVHQIQKHQDELEERREKFERRKQLYEHGRDADLVRHYVQSMRTSTSRGDINIGSVSSASCVGSGMTLRLMDDRDELLEMIRRDNARVPCTLPILCSNNSNGNDLVKLNIPPYYMFHNLDGGTISSSSKTTSPQLRQMIPFEKFGNGEIASKIWQELSKTATAQFLYVGSLFKEELGKVSSWIWLSDKDNEGLQPSPNDLNTTGRAITWAREYGERLKEHIVASIAETIKIPQKTPSQTQQEQSLPLPLPWWSLGHDEREWRDFPFHENIMFFVRMSNIDTSSDDIDSTATAAASCSDHDDTSDVDINARGEACIVVLESDLSTSIIKGVISQQKQHRDKQKKRFKRSHRKNAVRGALNENDNGHDRAVMKAELNARKMQHIIQDKLKQKQQSNNVNSVNFVHVLLGTNTNTNCDCNDSDAGSNTSNLDSFPCRKVFVNSLDTIVSKIVREVKDAEAEERVRSKNVLEHDSRIVEANKHESMNDDENAGDDESAINAPNLDAVNRLFTADAESSHVVRVPVWNAVDQLGRQIRHAGMYVISLPTIAVESVGRSIRRCGTVAVGHVASVGVGIRSILLEKKNKALTSRSRMTKIYVLTDDERIASWLKESLSHHGLEVHTVVGNDGIKSLSSQNDHDNHDDYYIFVNSSDDTTLHVATRGISSMLKQRNANPRRIMALVEKGRTKDMLKSFLGCDDDADAKHIPILCVSSIHHELFASTRMGNGFFNKD